MKKKILTSLFILSTILLFTGCGENLNIYNQISEENCIVACDYITGTVLKYQSTYHYKLANNDKKETRLTRALNERQEQELKEQAEKEAQELAAQNNATAENSENTEASTDGTSEVVEQVDDNVVELSAADIMGITGTEVTVVSCDIMDRYSEDEYYIIEPEDGYELLVVKLAITDILTEDIPINFSHKSNIKYKIIIGENDYLPLMTAAENDIMSLDTVLDPGSKTEAVIFYQVDKTISKDSIVIDIASDIGSCVLQIK